MTFFTPSYAFTGLNSLMERVFFFTRKVPCFIARTKPTNVRSIAVQVQCILGPSAEKQGHDQHDRPKRSQQPQHQAQHSCVEDYWFPSTVASSAATDPQVTLPNLRFSQKMSCSIQSWEVVSPSTPMHPSISSCLFDPSRAFHLGVNGST